MNKIQKVKNIQILLNKYYPKISVPLKHRNTFTLLISVLLSAQCTDKNVNNVTKNIYDKYYKPEHFVVLGRKKIEKLIKSIGIILNIPILLINFSIFFLPNTTKCSGL